METEWLGIFCSEAFLLLRAQSFSVLPDFLALTLATRISPTGVCLLLRSPFYLYLYDKGWCGGLDHSQFRHQFSASVQVYFCQSYF